MSPPQNPNSVFMPRGMKKRAGATPTTGTRHPQNRHTRGQASRHFGRENAMNRSTRAAALAGLVTAGPATAADLSLQRVILSSGGVGYFEYETAVDGDETLNLDVPLDQV